MGGYFRGERHKAGLIALVMASVAMSGWFRSLKAPDQYQFSLTKTTLIQFSSEKGILTLRAVQSKYQVIPANASSFGRVLLLSVHPPTPTTPGHVATSVDEETRRMLGTQYQWTLRGIGVAIGSFEDQEGLSMRVRVWIIPYWLIVVPLTALTAGLLLSKRRQPKSTESPPKPAA